ncbi:MAG: histidine ammonia-lyase [Anaerolineae bacterium]
MKTVVIDGNSLTVEDVITVAAGSEARVEISPEAREKIERARQAVENLVSRGEIAYGITTGFGRFMDVTIPLDQVRQLQRNILMSHAVGVGRPADEATVRATMLIRANTLAKGYSGVRMETIETLLGMINQRVHPVIPVQGSVGASGDLAPLAHMSLVLTGQGEAIYRGERLAGGEAMARAGLKSLVLEAKEGVALTNGTAFMTAIGTLTLLAAENASRVADIAGCLSLEALQGTTEAFDPRLHALRPYPHQVECAAYLRRLLEGSQFTRRRDPQRVHDAYTLRCIPQVHGAVRSAITHARSVIEIELNSASDNPLIFWEDGQPLVLSGGNFHGEPIALSMDYLALALTELGNISERRLARLIDQDLNNGLLPPFLTKQGGLNSGFMLAQYTAAALASENKVLVHPASADTIPTSGNQEDHVSMGPIAARQARHILDNVECILAIELLAAAQAIDFRREQAGQPLALGRGTGPVYDLIRQKVPFLERDILMYPYIGAVRRLVVQGDLVQAAEQTIREPSQPSRAQDGEEEPGSK